MRLIAVFLGVILAGCATGPHANPADPLEPFNRSVYKFNDVVDRAVVKPVATTYRDVTPALVQRGVSNFFNNLSDAWSIVNNVLQLKGEAAGDSFFRFGVNTLMGLGGILDVATEMRIERHNEDFGQTLGYWGVGPGPYIVLPILGSSSLRDTAALPADSWGDTVVHVENVAARNTAWALRATVDRASLLNAEAVIDQAALDKYSFIRDAYLQRRRNDVYDGDPPEEEPMIDTAPPDTSPK